MNEKIIYEQYQYIVSLILKKQLKDALLELKEYISDLSNWDLTAKLEQILTSYEFMLQYMRQNAVDPERKKVHNKLIAQAWEIADLARVEKAAGVSTRDYYNSRKYLASLPKHSIETQLLEMETFAEDFALTDLLREESFKNPHELRKRHQDAQEILFQLVWTNSLWKPEDEIQAQAMLDSALLPVYDLCLFTSAVTLSLMECFDLQKVIWLFKAYKHTNPLVNQRALVGLAIVMQLYHRRMLLYPEIVSRLTILNENEDFGQNLSRIQIQMLRSQETEKIDKKMREEIIPEMLKSANLRNMKFDYDETDEESNDHNPDWANGFGNTPLGDKIREMSELQMEGADVYMSTFSMLKNYVFFKEISNWFYPFDPNHSTVVNELSNTKSNSILDMILQSGMFCDSDKYSLCFTIMHIPQAQREAMVSQLSEQQIEDLKNEGKSDSLKSYTNQPSTISNQYIHNLYRFFRLHPRRHEFRDVFKESLCLNEYEILSPVLNKPDLLHNLAEYYFRKERYSEAIKTYERLLELTEDSAEVYQKIGYCLQKEKKYQKAIEVYLKSDMIKPDNIWTLRHLATCYRMNHEFKQALDYYLKIEEIQPENKNLIFNIGSCLAELGRYDEALKYFFKLDFIDPDNSKILRAIGWCSFISGKHEQAMRYYEKVIDNNPLASDFMNAGHVAWSMGNMEKAIEYYTSSVNKLDSKSKFLDMFYLDTSSLIEQGINEDDMPLMLDLL